MISIMDTDFYPEVLKEFNYSFGDVFVFDKFVVSEIRQGVDFSWDNHAKAVIDDVFGFLGTPDGATINLISNRINSYSVMASDWVKFFKNSYFLNSYIVVSDKARLSNATIEKLFFKGTIKHFSQLEMAINFVKNDMVEID
ncbi:hypothetical protein [Algibacter sp. L4_22]|uniref:hypothetical protein n=1 Tax=Algibacter sp. L4_22 TaxID=2942477 RepID=UPI00201B8416|nr:hypothetical protein [Algibacter sp. L4_22]MCL5129469.1 hypothetical protein [Algibacter sp. L4_22]